MSSPALRRAVDAAVLEARKPLADLSLDEVESLYARVIFYFVLQSAERGRKVVSRRESDAA